MSRIMSDDRRCVGCLTCVVTCLDHHYPGEEADAVPLRAYRKTVLPSGLLQYVTESCHHCQDAPCAAACPANALRRDADGFVRLDRAACVGCRACAKACPHDIPRFGKDRKLVKCDGCPGREPACLSACKRGALLIKAEPAAINNGAPPQTPPKG